MVEIGEDFTTTDYIEWHHSISIEDVLVAPVTFSDEAGKCFIRTQFLL